MVAAHGKHNPAHSEESRRMAPYAALIDRNPAHMSGIRCTRHIDAPVLVNQTDLE